MKDGNGAASEAASTLLDIGEGNENDCGVNASGDEDLAREPWQQTALALMGKPINTPVSSLVESDFELPERCRARLSAAGKVRRISMHVRTKREDSVGCQEKAGGDSP